MYLVFQTYYLLYTSQMNQLSALLKKYVNNQCSESELRTLFQLLGENGNQDILKELINENLNTTQEDDIDDPKLDATLRNILNKLQLQIEQEAQLASKYNTYPSWISVAAAVLFVLGIGLYFYRPDNAAYQQTTKQATVTVDEDRLAAEAVIKPGCNKAILTLANGKNIVLTEAGNGLLANLGSTQISKINDGELVYRAESQKLSDLPQINKLKIPRGGQYTITLPDGTKVWINADSELKFPTYFSGTERRVELKGEAYFEVAKNKDMPFKVVSGDQMVEVLGTHFNVNSYKNEGKIVTTLLEGSIKVYKTSKMQSAILKPGQQSIMSDEIEVKSALTEQATAWKDGLIAFKDADIEDIMRQLIRWYDIEVVYEGIMPNRLFTGKVSREANLSQILKLLEKSRIHFKIEGKTITVMPE